jgi:hypothetical protein
MFIVPVALTERAPLGAKCVAEELFVTLLQELAESILLNAINIGPLRGRTNIRQVTENQFEAPGHHSQKT